MPPSTLSQQMMHPHPMQSPMGNVQQTSLPTSSATPASSLSPTPATGATEVKSGLEEDLGPIESIQSRTITEDHESNKGNVSNEWTPKKRKSGQ